MSALTRTKQPASSAAAPADKNSSAQPLNPVTTSYEFFGPWGAVFIIVLCHVALLTVYAHCDTVHGCPGDAAPTLFWLPIGAARLLSGSYRLVSWPALQIYCAWLAWLVALYYLLPGRWVSGTQLRDGRTLQYKENALRTLMTTMAACVAALALVGTTPFIYIYDHALELVGTAFLLAAIFSTALYLHSFVPGTLLALGGNSGNPIYDFYIGRELNPRIGNFDIKCFTELRPGLMGWLVLNLCSAVKQYAQTGTITDSMWMVQLFQAWYVIDSLVNEAAVLTTMDIVTDGLGWMLTFGNLVWVPFSFSLQARFLAAHPVSLGPLYVLGILALQSLGYWIFRSANLQKDRFRKNPQDPTVKHLASITTQRGTRLLISGWWGTARHINYLGDWIMSVAWCLPCGFTSLVAYIYPLYFFFLLVHRERRDEHQCYLKYGADWRRYRRIVPWRIIPFLY